MRDCVFGWLVCFGLAVVFAFSSDCIAEDWPSFRGPTGDGLSNEKSVPTTWSQDENIKWKVPLSGAGNSSPIVSGGKVFVTYAEKKGQQRTLACFDRKDGKELWKQTVEFDQETPTHKTNPYCGSTPVGDGERVVVWHSSAGLFCYDMMGKELWNRNLGEFSHTWGYGSSPILHQGKIILLCGPGKKTFITSIDLKTGETEWETEEPYDGDGNRNENNKWMGSWSTPIIVKVDGKEQILCSLPKRVNGYDPATGKIVWSCDGLRGPKGDLAYSSPVIAENVVVATGGFAGPSIGFKLGGKGNITESNRLWRKESNPQSIGSGVFIDGHIYMANAGPNVLQCLDPKTGKELWIARGKSGAHWGSIVSADGNLMVTNQDGNTLVFKPNPKEFELVVTNTLGETSNSTPAISDGEIFIRTYPHLYCIRKK